MDYREIVGLVDRAGRIATEAAAREFLRMVLPYVPTSGGNLSAGSDSLRGNLLANGVKMGKDGQGWYGSIGIRGNKYAAAHYYGPLRHFFVGQDRPGALRRFAQPAVVKSERTAGRRGATVKPRSARPLTKSGARSESGRYLYGVAYRYARRAGLLSRAYWNGMPGLRWYDKAAADPANLRHIRQIYVGTLTELFG